MTQTTDMSRGPDYYSARADEERRLAESARDPSARAMHLEMAERYAALARGIDEPSIGEERVTAR